MNPIVINKIKKFMEFFSNIPAQLWCGTWREEAKHGVVKHCALGHLGATGGESLTPEATELCELLRPLTNLPTPQSVTVINDSEKYIQGVDHKERVLKSLAMRLEQEKMNPPIEVAS